MRNPRPRRCPPAEKGLGSSRSTPVPMISLRGLSEGESRSPGPSPPTPETGGAVPTPHRLLSIPREHQAAERGHGRHGSKELSGRVPPPSKQKGRRTGAEARTNPHLRDRNRGDRGHPEKGMCNPELEATKRSAMQCSQTGPALRGARATRTEPKTTVAPMQHRRHFQIGIGPFPAPPGRGCKATLHPARLIQENRQV